MRWTTAGVMMLALILSSCCTTGSVMIPVPPEPDYPKISRQELVNLSDETVEKLRDRDVMKTAYINRLKRLIEAAR